MTRGVFFLVEQNHRRSPRRFRRTVWVFVLVLLVEVCLFGWLTWRIAQPVAPATVRPAGRMLPIDPTVPVPFSTTSTSDAPIPAAGLLKVGRAVSPAARPTPPPSWARCPRMWRPAQRAGWPPELLPTLDFIAHRETRCGFDLVNERTRDYGWLQIHYRHLTTAGWTNLCARTGGRVCTTDHLLNMRLNLRAGWVLYQVHRDVFGCGWRPWHTDRWRPC